MPERIYTSTGDGKLEALEETRFPTEDALQALIAEHPELLDGEQIRPGDARRWILVTREKGIAASAGEGARWSVDHLIIDQDAVPTLAEVKRGSNPEIRRTIVGQLLEYAAHASETWTAEELRGMFERQAEARGRDAEAELATLLQPDGDPDVDGFREDVSTNLAAKRLRSCRRCWSGGLARSRRTALPRTSRARASRHGRSGTRRQFGTRTFWWDVFAASSRNWRRCDGLRESAVGSWPRRLKVRSVLVHRVAENVPQRCGIEDVGVEKCGDARHRGPYPMS